MANHALRMCHVLETRSLAMTHERSSVQARPTHGPTPEHQHDAQILVESIAPGRERGPEHPGAETANPAVRGVRVTPETASSRTAAWASGRHQDTSTLELRRDGRKIFIRFLPWEGFSFHYSQV